MTDDLIGRAEAQTAIQFAARRYTVAHEAHGEGQVVWSDNLISVTDAMNVLRDLPSAQPEPCEDAVSKEAVLSMIDTYMNKSVELHYLPTSDGIKKLISILPSAQPERKTGHWVETGDEPYDEWECDVCGFAIDGSGCIDPEEYRDVYKFCPNCGADMRGDKHEVD